jgi:hypothetical protein
MSDASRGLYRKFDVRRTDGTDAPGGKHEGCSYFVLDLTHDKYARAALEGYAAACGAEHPALAADLRRVVESPDMVPCPSCSGEGCSGNIGYLDDPKLRCDGSGLIRRPRAGEG